MEKLLLRAKPLKAEGVYRSYESYDLQCFEYWDHSDKKWKEHPETSKTLYEQRNPGYRYEYGYGERGMDLFEQWLKAGVYSEIQLQPLCFSLKHGAVFNHTQSPIQALNDLIDKKTNGLAMMRQFWNSGLEWNSSVDTRLTWKYDNTGTEQMYTIFEKGKWMAGSDPPDFQPDVVEHTINLMGLNLTGLRLKSEKKYFVAPLLNFDFTVCIQCELDGIRKATSFRGAHLRQARFCGNSMLTECDLTSTFCWRTHFDFPDDKIDERPKRRFSDMLLNEASPIDTAIFTFKIDSDDIYANPCYREGDDENVEYKINGFFGVWSWKYLSMSYQTLGRHKSELAYVVGEIERLRNYEAKKENWKEIIDSWIAFSKMPFATHEAKNMQACLFRQQAHEFMVIDTVLYSAFRGKPPYELLTRIKKYVGDTLLRNDDFYKNRSKLTEEIDYINDILHTKGRMDTVIQNFVLGIFIFFFTIGANIVSEEIKQRMLIVTGLE